MTESHEPFGFRPDDLDGFTVEDLSDYLDTGRSPRNPAIEESPGCQIALSALEHLRATTWAMLRQDAAARADRDTTWIAEVMRNISREAHAGRDIPIRHDDPHSELTLTEGSVRGLLRSAGDVAGTIIGRCALVGDITVIGEPIRVEVTASVAFGRNLHIAAEQIRERLGDALQLHTDLNFEGIDVTIQDIHVLGHPSTERNR